MTTGRTIAYNREYPPHAYLQQLARAKRFLDRYRVSLAARHSEPGGDWETVDDLLWTFFQHCWHVKDWLKNDCSVAADVRKRAVEAVHADRRLLIVADLANGKKHFLAQGGHTGAVDRAIQLVSLPGGGSGFVPVIEFKEGEPILATEIADAALVAWREILSAQGLDHFGPPD